MIGVILAAGVGSRLRPMTNNKPKCLVTVAGKPMLQYQLDAYKEAGITDIYIIVGYEANAIANYCKYIRDLNITIITNEIYEDTNNMYSLYLTREYIKGKPFILNNADLVVSSDLIKRMNTSKSADLVAVDEGYFLEESMKVVVSKDDFITDISKQVLEENSFGCSIDFYKFSETSSEIFFNEIERIIEVEENRKDWTEVAMQRLFNQGALKFHAMDIGGTPWVEVDNYDDLALADAIFSQLTRKIEDYTCYCLDLDGTVYVGGKQLDGVVETINMLKQNGKIIRFISNNSSKNKSDYVVRLKQMSVDVDESEIKISTDSAINYMRDVGVKTVYVLGTRSLIKAVIDAGFEICSFKPDIVLVGYDTELTYSKLMTACRLINNGVDYIATHCDVFCPTEFGPIPDIGCTLDSLIKTTSVMPYKVFGKPETDLLDLICKEVGVPRKDMLMVGDRIYTDIKMSNNANVDSVLVLSGETTRDVLEDANVQPTYILKSFVL